jgi:ketopantoate hydroxymethyltransferase
MLEELGGHHRADRVAAQVFRAGGAAAVPVETSQRIGPTWLKLAAEHITVAHIQQYPYRGR